MLTCSGSIEKPVIIWINSLPYVHGWFFSSSSISWASFWLCAQRWKKISGRTPCFVTVWVWWTANTPTQRNKLSCEQVFQLLRILSIHASLFFPVIDKVSGFSKKTLNYKMLLPVNKQDRRCWSLFIEKKKQQLSNKLAMLGMASHVIRMTFWLSLLRVRRAVAHLLWVNSINIIIFLNCDVLWAVSVNPKAVLGITEKLLIN